MKKTLIYGLVIVSAVIAGCGSTPLGPYGYTDEYVSQLANEQQAATPTRQTVERYLALFNPLQTDVIRAQADQLFAEQLYFNDTLATVHSREELKQHLLATTERLDDMAVETRSIIIDGQDVLVIWIMDAYFTVLGRQRHSRTLGVSQLRFNNEGQLLFHQDFWDSSQGLDQHLPLIGPASRWLRNY